ncbi:hypothetical protein SKAU_G00098790 [Synaphobranchus kaupii]|uniref:Uncharacterized protein n=1 Tax=Synaphobranchus kaupii TaxID=118154 RepID=A0A9Q1FY55_SYNKA|nr:hypothetical protein SKAU_G00098790 [Synaphobranchus kaupii]
MCGFRIAWADSERLGRRDLGTSDGFQAAAASTNVNGVDRGKWAGPFRSLAEQAQHCRGFIPGRKDFTGERTSLVKKTLVKMRAGQKERRTLRKIGMDDSSFGRPGNLPSTRSRHVTFQKSPPYFT